MTGRRFTRSVLKKADTSTIAAADTNNNEDNTMEVDTNDNNINHQPINNNRRSSPRRRSSQTSSNETNPILDDMSDIELDLSPATTSYKTNDDNVRTVSEEQITTGDEDDIDMEIGKLDEEQEQWPSPPANSSSNNDTSPTMATYQQQYYGGKSDNDKLKSYRISHLQHRISTLETQVSFLSSSTTNSNTSSTASATQPAYQPMSQTEEERLQRRISEMEYELQMRRNRTNRLRKLIMDYVKLPSIVIDDAMPQMLNGEGMQQLGVLNEQQLGVPMLNMKVEGANVVSPIVQMNVNNGEQVDGGLDSLPELPLMNLNDNVEDSGSSKGQSGGGKKRGYAEV